MFNFRIRGTRVAPHFGRGVGYGPSGAVGIRGSSLLAFGEKRRKAEVSTPLLCYRAERVWKAGGLRSERSGERQTSGSALPVKSFGIAVDAEMTDVLPGV